MLKNAYELLRAEYEQCLQIVGDDKFFHSYADEKWRHSLQVAGAGNYIIRRVQWLKDRDSAYLDMVKSAVLLHDVCRFAEITGKYRKNPPLDHGIAGGEFLRKTELFSDIRIWLPVKHHGHLIEELYRDEKYLNIRNESLRNEVKFICFIIRDADKIANLHMFVSEPEQQLLFLGKQSGEPLTDGRISAVVKENVFSQTTLPRWDNSTPADKMAGYLSWYFDINYRYSVDFCLRLNVIARMENFFVRLCADEEFKTAYLQNLNGFLKTHEFLL